MPLHQNTNFTTWNRYNMFFVRGKMIASKNMKGKKSPFKSFLTYTCKYMIVK